MNCYGCGDRISTETDYPHPFCTYECLHRLRRRADEGDEEAIRKMKAMMSAVPVLRSTSAKEEK